MRRAPAFWWRPDATCCSTLLAPAGWLYGAVAARRMAGTGVRLPVPVLCVGNLVAGGAGKTPTALALARIVADLGHRPAFLSRGYGRIVDGADPAVIRVDPDTDDAARVGDEPLLLAAAAPTYVARDRAAAARRAIGDGATVLILDDGLQNPALTKTLSIAVIDGARGIGNGACIPAGPLRAPLGAQWPHISAVLVVGAGAAGASAAQQARRAGRPVWSARLVPAPAALVRLGAAPVLAFAGIGDPEKFFTTLREHGLAPVATHAFPDHHRFTPAELTALRADADARGARLVTTEKDRLRLPVEFAVDTLPVALAFDDEAAIGALLRAALASGHG